MFQPRLICSLIQGKAVLVFEIFYASFHYVLKYILKYLFLYDLNLKNCQTMRAFGHRYPFSFKLCLGSYFSAFLVLLMEEFQNSMHACYSRTSKTKLILLGLYFKNYTQTYTQYEHLRETLKNIGDVYVVLTMNSRLQY